MKQVKDSFINKATKIHGGLYDYTDTIYTNLKTKVKIKCGKHGYFHQSPGNHLTGQGCPKCGYLERTNSSRWSAGDFISKAIGIHGDKYCYDKVIYLNSRTNIVIKCKIHGEFYQRPDHHLNGGGCPKCANLTKYKNANEARRLTLDIFIERAKRIHGDKYDYSLVKYTNSYDHVTIGCKLHGIFRIMPNNHLKGSGCPECGRKIISDKAKIPQDKILERFKLTHGDRYDYSEVVTSGVTEKITIICKKHGEFQQTPWVHAIGMGCSRCSSSRGEKLLIELMTKNNIEYVHQYKIPNTQYRYRYDFYLPKQRTLIEFQGEQHYVAVDYFGGVEGFKKTKFRDAFKKDLAKLCGIRLVYFTYKHLKLEKDKFEVMMLKTLGIK